MNRCLLLLALLVVFLAAPAAQSIDKEKLVGTWRYEDKEQVSTYVFYSDGTFKAELRQGEKIRKFEGLWVVEEGMITYRYRKDSDERANRLVERDRLMRIDESSYTIEAGDRSVRTYFRVK